MPIKPENRKRYPTHWTDIRAAILQRAGNACEQCGISNRIWRNNHTDAWTQNAHTASGWKKHGDSVTRIVLTIAHLDHTPEHCDPANLRALCQRCHLHYDAEHHQQTAYATRRRPLALGDLFDANL